MLNSSMMKLTRTQIGSIIPGGNANEILFLDSNLKLARDSGLKWNGNTLDVETTGENAIIMASTTDTSNAVLKLRVDKGGTVGIWQFEVIGGSHNFFFTEDDQYSPFGIESTTPTDTFNLAPTFIKFNKGLNDVDTIFYGDTSEIMRIYASTHRVGIGTIPDEKLHSSDSGNIFNKIESTTASITGFKLKNTTAEWRFAMGAAGAFSVRDLTNSVTPLNMDLNSVVNALHFTPTELVVNDEGNGMNFRVEGVGATHALFVQGSDGNVGIGTIPDEKLDVLGNIKLANTRSNGINKISIMLMPHRDNDTEEDIAIMKTLSGISVNGILWGGGNATHNAATSHDFYTAATWNTLNGISRLNIDSSGNITHNPTNTDSDLIINDDTSETARFNAGNHNLEFLDNKKITLGTTTTDLQIYSNGTQGVISTADDLRLDCGANKTIVLQEPVYNDLSLPLDSARVPAANAPSWETFVGNLNAFAYQVNDFQEFTQEILHNYKEGSTFQFHVHGALNATLAGGDETVKIEIEYSIADMDSSDGLGDVFPAPTIISAEFTVSNGTADLTNIYIVVGTDSTAAFKIGATIKGRVRRIASSGTELVGNIFLLSTNIHHEVDTMGSRTIADK